jgi:hypothetical protein
MPRRRRADHASGRSERADGLFPAERAQSAGGVLDAAGNAGTGLAFGRTVQVRTLRLVRRRAGPVGEAWLGARKRPRVWIAFGVVLVLSSGFVFGLSGQQHPMAAFAIVDIDGYPRRTPVTACADPLLDRPGVAAFRTMILSQVGGTDDGLAVCKEIANGSGTLSDHADGRAWDWHMNANRRADRAVVDRVLDWLLRTDERGHRNAMARRIGITYIIWNHLYYRVGSDDAQWVPYTSTSDPHDTHVHFSFSVAGASQQTSWWAERGPLRWLLRNGPATAFTLGQGSLRPLAGDWDGNGRDTIGAYDATSRQFTLWHALATGAPATTTPAIGPFGAIPFAGDWDGTGRDGIGVYEPLDRRFSFFTLSGADARPAVVFGAAGDLPIIGDWNGDGIDDIGSYTPASRTFSLLLPDGSVRTRVFGAVNDTPIVGDWNGDGIDDIGVFRSSTNTFWFADESAPESTAGGSQAARSVKYADTRHLPVIGDWDGDGTDTEGVVTLR